MTSLALLTTDGEVVPAVDALALIAAAGLLDLANADTSDVAEFIDNTRILRAVASEASNLASDELVARLDCNAKWTLRQDGWEIKAPSPEAGGVRYDTGKLKGALSDLVADGVISREGSSAALSLVEQTHPTPFWLLREISNALAGRLSDEVTASIQRQVAEIRAHEPRPEYRQSLAGIKALLKVPAARDAIEGAEIPALPPRRVVKVRRVA